MPPVADACRRPARRPRAGPAARKALLSLPLLLAADVAPGQFRPLRFDDDVAAQRRACADDDRIACWKDREIADGVRLSLGGDLRWRYEHTGHPRYGDEPQDRWGVVFQRHSVLADLRVGERWRGFAQLTASRANGRAGGPSPVDANRLDPTNLFAEWRSAAGADGQIGVRAGLQELQFGSARVIDAREGPNVRRSFEAVRAYAVRGDWRVDAFAAAPRQNQPGRFDDARSDTQALRGVYATRTAADAADGAAGGGSNWDVYVLHYEDTAARFVQGTAHERRWTLAARAFGDRDAWDWNWEFGVQGGHFGPARIRAWSVATDTGRRFDVAGRPRLGLLVAIASGDDDPDDGRLGTFNAMYPRGNYFGDEATLGPRNFFNLHPALTLQLSPQVELDASLDFFWRYSTRDGVYAPNGQLIRGPGDSRARYVATIASLGTTWTPTPRWTASAVLAYSKPGAFLRETQPAESLSLVSLTAQYRF